eukprot:5085683-Alexandrium_andersonii.AAC.1
MSSRTSLRRASSPSSAPSRSSEFPLVVGPLQGRGIRVWIAERPRMDCGARARLDCGAPAYGLRSARARIAVP